MARTVSVNIRLDENDKKNMEQVCEDLSLSMGDAFAILVCREGRIPFDVSIDPFYSQDNIAYMEGIAQDIRDGKARFSEHVIADLHDLDTIAFYPTRERMARFINGFKTTVVQKITTVIPEVKVEVERCLLPRPPRGCTGMNGQLGGVETVLQDTFSQMRSGRSGGCGELPHKRIRNP